MLFIGSRCWISCVKPLTPTSTQIDLLECLQLSTLALNINAFVTSVGLAAFVACETVFTSCEPAWRFPPKQYILLAFIFCGRVVYVLDHRHLVINHFQIIVHRWSHHQHCIFIDSVVIWITKKFSPAICSQTALIFTISLYLQTKFHIHIKLCLCMFQ